ncbi:MAG TPA: divalent cation transporter [Spongiibacteraceae bacterium]|nr:divalent cation transporter [Spongiibacteraceae bacterium]HUH37867.1 divalent cation transporter [Spongiibacteraceae bacterium]
MTLTLWQELALLVTGATLAGACVPLGAHLAQIQRFRRRWLEQELRHFVIALGGGLLLAAVALVLVPEGVHLVGGAFAPVALLFIGGVVFFLLERYQGRRHREAPQLTAMLADYVPESLAIGGMFSLHPKAALLLALLIGLQNLPEGFNAYLELAAHKRGGAPRGAVMRRMWLIVPLGPLLALLGWSLLADGPLALGAVMLLASGGILYLVFQDIAPQAQLRRHWAPPLGAVVGFGLGLLGNLLVLGE